MKNYKKAFTLAETLVTLSIIGIIAMIVIPNLKLDTTRRVNNTAAQKADMQVYQAALTVQSICPRWRTCHNNVTVEQNFRNILENRGDTRFIIGNVINDRLQILVSSDRGQTTSMSYTAINTGGIEPTIGCTIEGYRNRANNACPQFR